MQNTPVGKQNKLVALASIAAELHSVKHVAWSVSLAAKNAKIMSVQAGEKGRGFQPITKFIDEISQQVMDGTNEITSAALQLSKIAVNQQRCFDACRRFEMIIEKDSAAKNIKTLSPALKRVRATVTVSTAEFRKSLYFLTQLIEDMDQCMLSARAIASVSRIVTSDADEYRDKLNVVANDLDESAKFIKTKLSDSYNYLNSAKQVHD